MMSAYVYELQGIDIPTGDSVVAFGFSSKDEYDSGIALFASKAEDLGIKKFKVFVRGEIDPIFETVAVDPFDAQISVLIQAEELANELG